MNSKLDELLRRTPLLWRGRDLKSGIHGLSTGFRDLDAVLPAGGWPLGAVVEILFPRPGIGEMQLLLPAMTALTRSGQWVVWIEPPFIPYAPALEDAGVDLGFFLVVGNQALAASVGGVSAGISGKDGLWSMERVLRTPGCGMVLCWTDALQHTVVRRLQLAAESVGSIGVLLRGRMVSAAVRSFSPAALRLRLQPVVSMHISGRRLLQPVARRLLVQVLKARGSSVLQHVEISV